MLALSVNSDTEWEMQVLRWKTTEQACGGSRPSDKGGPDHPDPEMRVGGGGSQKNVFGLKIRGPPQGPSPGYANAGYRKTGTCLFKSSAS